jgi:threonine/homoserine/homoserine lactone efflux protein
VLDTSLVLESFAAFVAVSAVVICTPGQDTALTIRHTLAGGRDAGVATATGVALGQAVWSVAASAGVVAILSASEPAFRALKLLGAAYLVYLGGHSLWSAVKGRRSEVALRAQFSGGKALRQGLVSNLGNPKMAVFFASLLPQFAPGGSFATLLALGLCFCVLTLTWLTLYAVLVERLRRLLAGPTRRLLDALTGAALVVLGGRLAAEAR